MDKDRISKLVNKIKPYLFSYKDGFFEFPYFSHSPQHMIEGFNVTPFVKHNKGQNAMTTSTPFMKASIIYHELEDGLWVIRSCGDYKVNINFKRIVDKSHPADYYALTLAVSTKTLKKSDAMINGITYTHISWMLFKPEASNENCFLKGVSQETIMIFFSESYLQKTLLKDTRFSTSNLVAFFNSRHKIILWPEIEHTATQLTNPIVELLERKKLNETPNAIQLRELVFQIFYQFVDTYDTAITGNDYAVLSDPSRKKMLRAEKLLMNQVGKPFKGIESLAAEAGVSLSTLKADFKTMYGQSVYQYFKSHQLLFAKQLLKEGKYQVKDIGSMLGYESPSKFTAAFKKEFGLLPSDLSL